MILSEYEAKRAELDRRLQEVGEREAAHKMELSVKYQAECKRIQSQIGQLKKKQKELLQTYQNDKTFFHRKYRDEKHEICEKMHALRLEYLTVNNIETKETRKHEDTKD
jgi:seryl-tRNA synthetase